jgi:hypothetical protein
MLFWAAAVVAAQPAGEWRSEAPITYNIDYGAGHVGSAQYLKTISEAPPQLLHVGEDLPISSVYGTKDGFAGKKGKALTQDEIRAKIEDVKRYTASLHKAGVRSVIPYISNETAIGDHVARTGFFEYVDHWDWYSEFGFGPRPPEDLVYANKYYPFRTLFRNTGEEAFQPYKVYHMCTNNPYWRQHLLGVTANAARCGYDGVFVDVMVLRDYCKSDQEQFKAYLERKYTGAERRRRFGRDELSALSLGHPGQGALWYDTLSFWAESNADLLRAVREQGRKTNPSFFVVPNLGPFCIFDGVYKRLAEGMNPETWAPFSRYYLIEEMQRPGHFGAGVFFDYGLEYKVAHALGFRAGMLLYNAQDQVGIELSQAESGAGGGGGFIQAGYRFPEARRKYRRLFEERADLFDGYDSQAEVAVVFSFDQLYWGNTRHLQSVYRLNEYLSEQHITYDLVPLSKMSASRLSRYRAVTTPHVEYMSNVSIAALESYAAGGGVWLDLGLSGRFDDAGQLRAGSGSNDSETAKGKGRIIRRSDLDDLMDPRRFALYLLRENAMEDLPGLAALLKTKLGGENPFPPSRKKEDLRDLLNRNQAGVLPVAEGPDLEGLRTNVWRRREADGETITIHFVNYNCPIPTKTKRGIGVVPDQPAEDLKPRTLRNIAARIRVPSGKVTSVRIFDPDQGQPETLEFHQQTQSVEFTLPELRIYKIVQVRVSKRIEPTSRPSENVRPQA